MLLMCSLVLTSCGHENDHDNEKKNKKPEQSKTDKKDPVSKKKEKPSKVEAPIPDQAGTAKAELVDTKPEENQHPVAPKQKVKKEFTIYHSKYGAALEVDYKTYENEFPDSISVKLYVDGEYMDSDESQQSKTEKGIYLLDFPNGYGKLDLSNEARPSAWMKFKRVDWYVWLRLGSNYTAHFR
jgi:hypothetical protein